MEQYNEQRRAIPAGLGIQLISVLEEPQEEQWRINHEQLPVDAVKLNAQAARDLYNPIIIDIIWALDKWKDASASALTENAATDATSNALEPVFVHFHSLASSVIGAGTIIEPGSAEDKLYKASIIDMARFVARQINLMIVGDPMKAIKIMASLKRTWIPGIEARQDGGYDGKMDATIVQILENVVDFLELRHVRAWWQ